MGQGIGMRADGRLSLSKGEEEGEGLAGAGAESNPSPSSSPVLRGRGGIETVVDFFGANRISLKPIINES
jgi:hypothetical protein